MTLEQAYNQGYVAGIKGIDPRLCPFDKLDAEWRSWHQGHHWGAWIHVAVTSGQEESNK